MTPGLRKLALSVHLTFSVGWIGTVIAYLVFSVAAMTSQDPQTVRASWIAMDLTGWYVIVPLALASWLTGLVMALGTKWGLFRHYWVLFSLVLTTLATAVLLSHMPGVSELAEVAREAGRAGAVGVDGHLYGQLSDGDLLHPGLGLVVLLTVQVLNVYKPQGMTRYGRRKQKEARARTPERVPAEA
ncbi:MAG: DUF2269 family protein [Actinomycetota bacterium]